jgi:hypothetical protein
VPKSNWRKGTIWEQPAKPSKYRNVRTEVDGWTFDSKREAKCYAWLKALVDEGEILYFLRQVPIHLAPPCEHNSRGVVMRVDFMLAYPDDSVRYLDAKGVATRDWLNKAAMAENLYGIKIEVW